LTTVAVVKLDFSKTMGHAQNAHQDVQHVRSGQFAIPVLTKTEILTEIAVALPDFMISELTSVFHAIQPV
jgi:hypothetical protein